MTQTGLQRSESVIKTKIAHFWAATDPFFLTKLIIVPGETETVSAPVRLTLFDPDGEQINDAFVEIRSGGVESFDLAEFMIGCKREGGLQHAHIQAQSSRSVSYIFRIEKGQFASLLGEPCYVSKEKKAFFPLCFEEQRNVIFGSINCSHASASLLLTLSLNNTQYRKIKEIPPFGCRVISVRAEFQNVNFRNSRVAYLECALEEAGREVGVQMIEEMKLPDGSRGYYSLT
jgi:hypothetical protein